MEGNRPKRRKDKYNPYTICESECEGSPKAGGHRGSRAEKDSG